MPGGQASSGEGTPGLGAKDKIKGEGQRIVKPSPFLLVHRNR